MPVMGCGASIDTTSPCSTESNRADALPATDRVVGHPAACGCSGNHSNGASVGAVRVPGRVGGDRGLGRWSGRRVR